MTAPKIFRFPFPVRVGTDICQISRVRRILRDGVRGVRLVERVLAPEERVPGPGLREPIAWVLSRGSSGRIRGLAGEGKGQEGEEKGRGSRGEEEDDPRLWKAAVFMAGRFAAKEAAIKAHPHRRLTFHDIVITNNTVTAPVAAWPGGTTSSDPLGHDGVVARGEEGEGETTRTGAPVVTIRDSRSGGGGGRYADQEAMLSISHDGDYATAVCMGFDPSATG